MTANRNLLRIKIARVIQAYAARTGCTLSEALDRFYRSKTGELMRSGISDMHCMSDDYLVEEILEEGAGLSNPSIPYRNVDVPSLSVAEPAPSPSGS